MAGQKRALDDSAASRTTKRPKKSSPDKSQTAASSNLVPDEVDFPRGGGTSFTPLEVKNIRAEAVKDADKELFEVRQYLS